MNTTLYPNEFLGPKIDLNTIETFEEKHVIRLPEDYRQFLLKYNGGGIEGEPVFLMENNEDDNTSALSILYGIGHTGREYSLEWNILTYSSRMIKGFLPIGTDPYGNQICMSLIETEYGRIYFWDHERETDPPDYSNCFKIAESFTNFMESLKLYDEDESPDGRTVIE